MCKDWSPIKGHSKQIGGITSPTNTTVLIMNFAVATSCCYQVSSVRCGAVTECVCPELQLRITRAVIMGNWVQQPPSEDSWTPDWDQTQTDVSKFEDRGSNADQDHDLQT